MADGRWQMADVKGGNFAYPFRCNACTPRCNGCLPLDEAIGYICDFYEFDLGWCSIYMTIALMCGEHELAEPLEDVRLQFRTTEEVERKIYSYVKDGKVADLAALLTVAREEVTSPSLFKGLCDPALNGNMSLRQLVLSEIASLMASQMTLVSTCEELHDELNNKLETMISILRMIEVFERVGDKTELYRRYLFKVVLCNASVSLLKCHEWKLYEGMQLESGTTKICKKHDVDPMWIPRFSNQPMTLEAVPILNNKGDAKSSLPLKKSFLESIRLVACKTEAIEAIGCELASLDAEVRLMGRSNSRKLVEKCKDEREMKLSALMVLEVFERAGNSINQYLQLDAYNDGTRSTLEIVREIQNLFEKAGLDMMKPRDTDLNDIDCFSPTLDPVDHTSLPLALRSHEFSVVEHLFGMQRGLPITPLVQGSATGSRTFLTMVQSNTKRCGPRVSVPKSKAIPNILRRSIRWFLSAGVDISKMDGFNWVLPLHPLADMNPTLRSTYSICIMYGIHLQLLLGDLPVSCIYQTSATAATSLLGYEVTQCQQANSFQMGILYLIVSNSIRDRWLEIKRFRFCN
ncbi:hypothetical protein V6N11_014565 [Hibiscus sabdariffa]|uniref:Uncharacterized protein n=1 Tax=Hibiscus sabdariffa TaxID=183260 RepID=A0ABR2TPR9_9ROSI